MLTLILYTFAKDRIEQIYAEKNTETGADLGLL